jgi:hypothetical protein
MTDAQSLVRDLRYVADCTDVDPATEFASAALLRQAADRIDAAEDRAEKAEAELAALRERASESLFAIVGGPPSSMPVTRGAIVDALKILVPGHPFLTRAVDNEAKGGDQ